MKKLLLVAVIGSACVAPSAKAFSLPKLDFPSRTQIEAYAPAVLVVAAFGGLFYFLYKNRPFNLLNDARSNYEGINKNLLTVLNRYEIERGDIAALASDVYLKPSRSLVDVMLALEKAQRALKVAREDLDIALTLLAEKNFVQDCTYLKTKVTVRLVLIEDLISVVRTHALWASQYDLYIKEENERLAREERELERELNYDSREHYSYPY